MNCAARLCDAARYLRLRCVMAILIGKRGFVMCVARPRPVVGYAVVRGCAARVAFWGVRRVLREELVLLMVGRLCLV